MTITKRGGRESDPLRCLCCGGPMPSYSMDAYCPLCVRGVQNEPEKDYRGL